MGHKIAEAVIEGKEVKYTDKKLPSGKIKVHIVYDDAEQTTVQNEIIRIIKETAGIYKDIDVDIEAKKLRSDWERDVRDRISH